MINFLFKLLFLRNQVVRLLYSIYMYFKQFCLKRVNFFKIRIYKNMIVLFCGVYVMMSWSNLILFIVLCDIKIEKVKFEKKL